MSKESFPKKPQSDFIVCYHSEDDEYDFNEVVTED